jgi:hypothetical protein
VYARETGERTLTFGVSGNLIMNALVMYDHQTDSLWSQFLGEAVQGPLEGRRLDVIPALQTSWGAWLGLHPDTTALDKAGGFKRDRYDLYYSLSRAGLQGEWRKDDRLDTKDLVLGLETEGKARAYSFQRLEAEPLVNDRFQGRPVLIVFDAASETGVAYDRSLDGRVLTFRLDDGRGATMVDRETGTRWTAITGEAVEGELAGARLERVPSHYSFWFAWKDYYPETEVYE